MARINLVKRSETSNPLTNVQVDQNWTDLEDAVNTAKGLYYNQGFAISDETTALTTGTKLTVYLPVSLTNLAVAASVVTAPTGAILIIDIHKAGSTIMTTDKIDIDISEFSTNTAANPPVVTTTTYTAFDKLEIIVDQIGSTVAGAGAKVFIIGNIV